MQVAAPPANELTRLQALRDLLILDTPPEQRFDRIVQFAAREFDVPIAVISLVDDDRQWFKARVGIDTCGTPRDVAFCAHALHASDLLIVTDATQDARFCANPLVTGEPGIRFYAGAPLQLACGSVLGTLCVIDTTPRRLDSIELAILRTLRDLVVGELTGCNDNAAHGEPEQRADLVAHSDIAGLGSAVLHAAAQLPAAASAPDDADAHTPTFRVLHDSAPEPHGHPAAHDAKLAASASQSNAQDWTQARDADGKPLYRADPLALTLPHRTAGSTR